jgi:hypothetical protein
MVHARKAQFKCQFHYAYDGDAQIINDLQAFISAVPASRGSVRNTLI